MGGNRRIATKALNKIGARVGDVVTVESNSSRMLWYGQLVFILPIAVVLLTWGIVSQFTPDTVIQTLSAFGGFSFCLLGVAIYSKKVLACRCDVEIVEIVTDKATN